MKKYLLIILLVCPLLFTSQAKSQGLYFVTSMESLFQWADVPSTPQPSTSINENLRYTIFFNMGQYLHYNFSENVGLYSGLAIRNVGFIYDVTDIPTKTIRRSYNLGVPLALKIGVFDKHLYLMGGAEYELLFHYKGKRWDSNDRNGTKYKDSEWFSSKTKRFVPSWFVGVQFPGGINIKYKQYIGDFINPNYNGSDLGVQNVSFSDYGTVKMHYISVCWQFPTNEWRTAVPGTDKIAYR